MNPEQWFREYIGLSANDGDVAPRRVTDADLMRYMTPSSEIKMHSKSLIAHLSTIELAKNDGKPFEVAGFIGRMQPPHEGHFFCIELALAVANQVIIGIGSAEKHNTPDNPFSVKTRERLLRKGLIHIPNAAERVRIVHLEDNESDDVWCEETIKRMQDIQIIVGNNGWVNDLLREKWHIPALEFYFERNIWQGTAIREQLRKQNLVLEETLANPISQIRPVIF